MPTLLALTPHPDDESYTASGLLALASDAGWRCIVACATRGERGERFDGGSGPLGQLRERELTVACEAAGAGLELWGLPDGGLAEMETDLRHLSSDAVGRHKPDLIVTMGRDGVYGHPDHLALHRGVTSMWRLLPATRLCPLLYFAFPEGLFLPQTERCVAAGVVPRGAAMIGGVAMPDYRLPIAGVVGRKRAAIAAHRSQLPGGDPAALFPAGIVDALMTEEWFVDADGEPDPAVGRLFEELVTHRMP